MSRWKTILFWLFLTCCGLSFSRDVTFTLEVKSGTKECFYEYINEGAFLEVEYQVTQGGDLDINFEVNDPNGKPLVAEVRRKDGLHGIDVKVTGDFEICMDNTFSHLTDKVVFFDIIVEDDSGETEKPPDVVPYQLTKGAVMMDMKVKDIMSKLDGIGKKLDKVVNTQNYFQAREARHKHTADSNYRRVSWWSLIECAVIITVGMIQVVLIRNLFKTNRKDRIRT